MAHRVYRLRVTPEDAPDVHRTIDFDGRHTLHHVHAAIQREFELDDDHLHAFFLSGRYWDRDLAFYGPSPDNPAGQTQRPLSRLELRKGQTFAYLFDFGDELRHSVEVIDVMDVPAPLAKPTLVEAVGDAPPQYPEYDDDDDDDDEPFVRSPEFQAKLRELLLVVERIRAAIREDEPGEPDLDAATKAAHELATGLGRDDDLLIELDEDLENGLFDTLFRVPHALAEAGRMDDAESVARAFAPFEPEVFLGDLSLLLAEAGKREAALAQLEHNLSVFGYDGWIRVKAAAVYAELGDAAKAEAEFRIVLDADVPQVVREECVERLSALLEAQGRTEEAEAVASLMRPQNVPLPQKSAPKVGRNDPCPCGSGRKFKKCCGAA